MLKFFVADRKDIEIINNNFYKKYKIDICDNFFEFSSINKKFIFVVKKEKNDNILGFLETNILLDESEIFYIEIFEKYRGQKLAIFLMNNFLKFIEKFNIKNIFLEVRKSNMIAINLYKKFGFEVLYFRKNYYSNPTENAVVMKLEIKLQNNH